MLCELSLTIHVSITRDHVLTKMFQIMAFVSKLSRRGFSSSSALNAKIQEVVIIGGGLMGAGIAQVAAQTGHKVTVVDVSQEMLEKWLNEKRGKNSSNLGCADKSLMFDLKETEDQDFIG